MQPFFDNDQLVDEIVSCARAAIRGAPCWQVLDEHIERTLSLGLELPLLWLRTRAGLSIGEQRVAWILLAHELDVEARLAIRESLSEQLSDVPFDALRRFVYVGAARLSAWQEIGPTGRLRRLGYIQRTDGAIDSPEHRQTFKIARRVLALAHGDTGLDPDMFGYAALHAEAAEIERLIINGDVASRVAEAANRGGNRIVVVHGRKGQGRRSLLTGIARGLGHGALTIDASKLSTDREQATRQVASVHRECALLAVRPLIVNLDALEARDNVPGRLDLLDKDLNGLMFATSTTSTKQSWKWPVHQFELHPLTRRETALMWRAALPQASVSDGDALADTYPLAPALINAAGKAANDEAGHEKMRPEHIHSGIRSVLDERLGGLARRLDVQQSWDDLVLPDEQYNAVIEFLARIRQRATVYEQWGFAKKIGKGLGVAALFSGPPGTGKTMTASLIAAAVGLEVFQVDTSKITSKWIGETEKNLGALFDAAEAGHAILLFDEADALFGKRSDVKSSNDRHANQEVNFLLQRLETFSGICVLTTNHETALDEAFRRRIAVHVKFAIPDEDEREKLWRAMLPAAAPVEPKIDFTGLARRFAMTGGYIRNAALRAAFLAADEGVEIGSAHLEHAARLEYEGMGKIVTPASTLRGRLSSAL